MTSHSSDKIKDSGASLLVVKKERDSLVESNRQLMAQVIDLRQKESQVQEYKMKSVVFSRHNQELKKKLEKYSQKMFSVVRPFNQEFIQENANTLTPLLLSKGPFGLAQYITRIMTENDTKANYICTDLENKKFRYVNNKLAWVEDKGCSHLKKILYPALKIKCSKIMSNLRASVPRNDELIGRVMHALDCLENNNRDFFAQFISHLAALTSLHEI